MMWSTAFVFFIACLSLKTAWATTCTAVSPSNSLCGIQGKLKHFNSDQDIGEPAFVNSVEECALLCSRRVFDKSQRQLTPYLRLYYCRSFDFDLDTGFCRLSNKPLHPKNISPQGNHTFFSYDCFDCGDICDQPLGSQLLDNGDFEKDAFQVGPWGSYQGGSLAKGRNSKRAYTCRIPPSAYFKYCKVAQAFNMCYEQLYAISFWYREQPKIKRGNYVLRVDINAVYRNHYRNYYNNVTAPFNFGIFFSQSFAGGHSSLDTSWKQVKLYFRKPSEQVFTYMDRDLTFQIDNAAFAIDDVKVERIDSNLGVEAGSEELFANGGFETGNFSSYHVNIDDETRLSVSSPGINSTYALMFRAQYGKFKSHVLSQSLNTVTGATYLFSMDLRVLPSEKKPNTAAITVDVGFGAVKSLRVISYSQTYAAGNYTFRTPVFARNETTLFNLDIYPYEFDSGSTILVDNLSLKQLASSSI